MRLDAREPVVLFDETATVNAKASFILQVEKHFAPNKAFFRYGGSFPGGMLGMNTTEEIRPGTVYQMEPWLHWQYAKARGSTISLYHETQVMKGDDNLDELLGDEDPDLLTIAAREASVWVDPALRGKQAEAVISLVKNAQGLTMTFPLKHGARKWLLAVPNRAESLKVAGKGGVSPLPEQLLVKHGHFPLELVKDYIYTWPNTDAHPREILTEVEIAHLRATADPEQYERLARQASVSEIPLYQAEGPLRAYLVTQSPELGKKIVATALRQVQEVVDYLVTEDGIPYGCAPHNNSGIGIAPVMADFALGTAEITPTEREQLLAQLAFIGYTLARPEYWSPERGFAGLPNMTTTVYGYQTSLACAIPSHPLAKAWVQTALDALTAQVRHWSDENGGWLEAPHYAMVSYDVFVGSFLKLYNAGFSDMLYDPQMKKIIEWFGKISTPPDPRILNIRHKPPIGNTYLNEPTGEFGIIAYLWREKDPQFASEMQWMFKEQLSYPEPGIGGAYPALMGFRGLLLDPTIPAKAPAWGSELFPRTGAILRSGFPTDRETQMHIIAGDFRSHYDIDSGSITLWGKGRPLADDFGYYGCAPVEDHSRVETPQAYANLMPKAFKTTPGFDYFRGQGGGWTRQIGFVKDADPLAPNYFVLRDTLRDAGPVTWRLWCATETVRLGREAPAPVEDEILIGEEAPDTLPELNSKPYTPKDAGDFRALAVGVHDVDLDVIFLGEPWTLKTELKTRVSASGLYPSKNWYAMPSTQKGIIATHPKATTLTAILYPRLKMDKPPTVTTIADGKGVKIQHAAGTDYVFLASEPFTFTEGKLTFTGMAGVIRLRERKKAEVVVGE